ncbi:MAG: hypothetical protein NC393_08125 [Clostridium sp.]|nr:hypothetical protein [Clostridium sp.]MCM1207644.1 hypothetical protein [Ruminococcus sp.]
MKYRNVKTGAEIDIKSQIISKEWQVAVPAIPASEKVALVQKKKPKEKKDNG